MSRAKIIIITIATLVVITPTASILLVALGIEKPRIVAAIALSVTYAVNRYLHTKYPNKGNSTKE